MPTLAPQVSNESEAAAPQTERATDQQATVPATGFLLPGKEVLLADLQARPDLNGKSGTVQGYLWDVSRYVVTTPGPGTLVYVKKENLRVAVETPPAQANAG